MNYEEISDFEINKAIADLLLINWHIRPHSKYNESHRWVFSENYKSINEIDLPDYCNSPSDAWPIIFENQIGITPHGEKWMANNFNPSSFGSHQVQTAIYAKNPLRAAMVVFLMMKGDSNEQ